MNLLFGQVVDLFSEDGVPMGKIRCGGAMKSVPVTLVTDVHRGDVVFVCDGVALGKVAEEVPPSRKEEALYVSGHSR